MRLITSQTFGLTSGVYTWTAPAGVTRIMIVAGISDFSSGPTLLFSAGGGLNMVTVVPNTTYTITIPSNLFTYAPSTFGSLFSAVVPTIFYNAPNYCLPLTIMWMDG